ncbi:MAG: hypothetical protein ACTHN5_24080 [Phycisphaerae bacterium]
MMAGETAPWRGGKVNFPDPLTGPSLLRGAPEFLSQVKTSNKMTSTDSFPLPPFSFQFQLARCAFFFREPRPQRDVEISLLPGIRKGNFFFRLPRRSIFPFAERHLSLLVAPPF